MTAHPRYIILEQSQAQWVLAVYTVSLVGGRERHRMDMLRPDSTFITHGAFSSCLISLFCNLFHPIGTSSLCHVLSLLLPLENLEVLSVGQGIRY